MCNWSPQRRADNKWGRKKFWRNGQYSKFDEGHTASYGELQIKLQLQFTKKKIYIYRASLVTQWLGVCLLMQGTRVRALVWEDPTCCGATGPVSHNCWACASGASAPQQERPRWWEARAPRWRAAPACRNWRRALAQKRRPNIAINQSINKSFKKKYIYIYIYIYLPA